MRCLGNIYGTLVEHGAAETNIEIRINRYQPSIAMAYRHRYKRVSYRVTSISDAPERR